MTASGQTPTITRVAGVLLIVLSLFVPEVLVQFTPLRPNATFLVAGALPTLLGWMLLPRYAIAAIPLAASANALAVLAFGHPVLTTVFVGAMAAMVGLSAVKGLHPVAIFVAVQPSVTVISGYHAVAIGGGTPGVLGQALIGGAMVVVGGLWAVLVAAILLRKEIGGAPDPVPGPVVVFYTGALILLLVPTAAIASTWFLDTTAGWILMTILLVTRPTYHESWTMIADRGIGTVIGGALAAVVAILVADTGALIALGTLAMIIASVLQMLHVRYFHFAVVVTVAIVLLNAEQADVFTTDVQRILFTIIGVLLVAVAVSIAEVLLGRHTDPTVARDEPATATSSD